jgi:hypothetical protein
MMTRLGRSRVVAGAVVVASALAITLGFVRVVRGSSVQSTSPARAATADGLPGELTGPAPWPRNVTALRERLTALGLPALQQEGTTQHIHQHLDIFVNGRRVPVPAGIGIDAAESFISPLHTHDATGVIHVESPVVEPFTLGELFGVWGVRLTPHCLGGYCAGGGKHLWVYVDGRLFRGDPRLVLLEEHEEIVVAFGTRAQLPRPVPATYPFPSGL